MTVRQAFFKSLSSWKKGDTKETDDATFGAFLIGFFVAFLYILVGLLIIGILSGFQGPCWGLNP